MPLQRKASTASASSDPANFGWAHAGAPCPRGRRGFEVRLAWHGPLFFTFLALAALMGCDRVPRASAPLAHDVYVWQRHWSPPVVEAVSSHGPHFQRLVCLAAEISWVDRSPQVARAEIDFEALRRLPRRAGLALRIGPFPGPFTTNDDVALFLASIARGLLDDARRQGLEPAELQIDFDCAEAKLDGYRAWVQTLRAAVSPTPTILTALPAWLNERDFAPLVRSADGFVLQVHSLEPPRDANRPFRLCDPVLARRAVEQASRAGVPFRVALPTYGYLAAFAPNGNFLGLSAEGPVPAWPPATRLIEVRSDPAELAHLVAGWNGSRPSLCTGVIWYRLPVAGDRLNLPWPTLASVMAGRLPRVRLVARATETRPGLVEIQLINDGDATQANPAAVRMRSPRAATALCDGVGGFQAERPDPETILFTSSTCRLPPGARVTIGWVRTDTTADRSRAAGAGAPPPFQLELLP